MKIEKIFPFSKPSVVWGLILFLAWMVGWSISPVAPSFATSFVEQPFSETIQDAPVIVRGKIGKTAADWGYGSGGGKQIFTFSDLEVSEVFKGNISGKSIVIRELGGEKDGIGMHVAGASSFQRGEDVVVFLSEKNSEGSYDVRGLMMGKYNLEKDISGNEVLVGPGIGRQTAPGEPEQWTLEAFRHVIHRQAKAAAQVPSPQKGSPIQPSPAPIVTPSATAARATEPAPALQNSSPEEPKNSPGNVADGFLSRFILVWIGLGVLAAWGILRKKRR